MQQYLANITQIDEAVGTIIKSFKDGSCKTFAVVFSISPPTINITKKPLVVKLFMQKKRTLSSP